MRVGRRSRSRIASERSRSRNRCRTIVLRTAAEGASRLDVDENHARRTGKGTHTDVGAFEQLNCQLHPVGSLLHPPERYPMIEYRLPPMHKRAMLCSVIQVLIRTAS